MEFKTTCTNRRCQVGFTLLELLIASGISVVVLTAVLSLGFYTARSIAAMSDSVDLNARSRYAIDRMSKKLRQASEVQTVSPTAITVSYNGKPLSYTYQSASKVLIENENGQQTTLLRDCVALKFSFYKRNPMTNSFNQYPVGTATNETKVIQVHWQCRTTLIGKAGGSGDMPTAKVVLRSK